MSTLSLSRVCKKRAAALSFITILLFTTALWGQTTNAPADFTIYPKVMAPNPVPSGFNLQPSSGTNISENSWLVDGGFSPYDERASFTASQGGTATTFTATGKGGTSVYGSVVANYWAGAKAQTYRYLNNAWSLVRTDTVASNTAGDGGAGAQYLGSTAPADNVITFAASGPAILAGDVLWLDLDNVQAIPKASSLNPDRFGTYSPTWNSESQQQDKPSIVWDLSLDTDVPASDIGGLSMKVTEANAVNAGIWQYIQGAFNGPTEEQFQTGHNYTVDVWLKQSGVTSGSATFSIPRIGVSHTFTGITSTWQHFTYTFAGVPGVAVGVTPSVHLVFSAPGTMWIDNFQLYDAGWAPNTLSPDVLTAWENYHPGTVRIWSNFAYSSGGYAFLGLDSWLTPEIKTHNVPGIGNIYEYPLLLEHLPDALANVKTIGSNPWLIVNMSLSNVEWGELIDYLSAPAGVGYAAKRPANHPGPYTADFSTIYLELGNEEWGTQTVPVDFAYGQWGHFVMSQAIAGKTYFDPAKIKFIVNGSINSTAFGSAAATAAPEASIVDYALYAGPGRDPITNQTLTGDVGYTSELLNVPGGNQSAINAYVAQQQLDAAKGVPYSLASYEQGPGTDIPVSGQAPLGDPTLAAAIASIDTNLYASLRGFGAQNYYMYSLGTGPYTSHSNFANGFLPHPAWEAYQMRNQYTAGPMMWTTANTVPVSQAITEANPTPGGPALTVVPAGLPLIGVYSFQDANNQADVVVISRDLNNPTPVTLHFPAVPTGTAQLYTLTGDPRATNNTALNVPIGHTTAAVTQDYTFTMPAGSMYIFHVPMTGSWNRPLIAPAAPASLNAVSGNATVALTWAPSDGAQNYIVKRGTVSGGPYTQIATTTSIAYTDNAVANNSTYYYVVVATNSGGNSPNSPEAIGTPNFIAAGSTTTLPPLDGSGGGAWTNVAATPLNHHFKGSSPDTASYKVLWDATNLYLLVSVQDSTPIQSSTVWNGDSVEVYWSGTDSQGSSYGPSDFQFAFPWNGTAVTEGHGHSTAGITFAQMNVSGGYQMAITMPWSSLLTSPVANKQYGFDVMIDDAIPPAPGTELGKLGWWATADNTWSNPSLMGPLVLSATGITSVSVSCTPSTIAAGATSTCTSTVNGTGTYNTAVTWSATAGTITSAGVYTAPSPLTSPENVTIVAHSVQDPTAAGTAVIAVTPSSSTITGVTVSCASTSINTSATDACTASVAGTGSYSSGVTWSVSSGSVNSSGLVTAPATAGTIVVTATSTQDPTKSGTKSITVTVPSSITGVTVSCAATSIAPSATDACTPTVSGTGSFGTGVTWSVTGGSVNTTGLVTAPATTGTIVVTATSTQDPTKSGTKSITVTSTSTVTGVTVSCASSHIALSATDACTATVAGTGSFSSAVTWSVSAGTVTNTGLVTAPSTAGNFVVTATSTQDATKHGTYTINASVLPVFSNVTVTNVTSTSVTISWTSNVPINAGIDYGPTYNFNVYDGSVYTTTPSFTLTGLTAGTTYNALAFGYNNSRAFGSYGFRFTTAP